MAVGRKSYASFMKALSKMSPRKALKCHMAARSRAYKIGKEKQQWVPSLPVVAEEEPEAEPSIEPRPEEESEPEQPEECNVVHSRKPMSEKKQPVVLQVDLAGACSEPEPESEPEEGIWSYCVGLIEGLWQEQN